MIFDSMQADAPTPEQVRKSRFDEALRLIEEHGARMIIPARPELCLLDAFQDAGDPEHPNASVAPRFDRLPERSRQICRLAASLCRLILAAPLFTTDESHDERRDWRNRMIHLPGIGPFVHIMYRGNPIRPNMITSLGSATRMLEWHVLRRDDIPPDVRSDIVAVCEQWHSPPMRGYVDLDIDSKIRIGKMVRDHAERLLAVLTR